MIVSFYNLVDYVSVFGYKGSTEKFAREVINDDGKLQSYSICIPHVTICEVSVLNKRIDQNTLCLIFVCSSLKKKRKKNIADKQRCKNFL